MQPATELFVIMIVIFLVGICMLFATYMKDNILVPMKDKLSNPRAINVINNIEFAFTTLDQVFLFVSVGLGLASVLLAYMTPAKPAFLLLAVFMFAITLLIVPTFANIFQDMTEKSQFSAYTTNYPITVYIFHNFPLFFFAFGFMIVIVLFAKIRGGGDV